jgi:hypothetical protein
MAIASRYGMPSFSMYRDWDGIEKMAAFFEKVLVVD